MFSTGHCSDLFEIVNLVKTARFAPTGLCSQPRPTKVTAVTLFVLFFVTSSLQLTGCHGGWWFDWYLGFSVFIYFVLYWEQSFFVILCVVKVNTEELLKSSYWLLLHMPEWRRCGCVFKTEQEGNNFVFHLWLSCRQHLPPAASWTTKQLESWKLRSRHWRVYCLAGKKKKKESNFSTQKPHHETGQGSVCLKEGTHPSQGCSSWIESI